MKRPLVGAKELFTCGGYASPRRHGECSFAAALNVKIANRYGPVRTTYMSSVSVPARTRPCSCERCAPPAHGGLRHGSRLRYSLRYALPPAPLSLREREADGASWRHTRRVCRQDAPSGFPIRINFRAVALKTHFVVRDVASFAGNIAHDKDILWGPEAPKPPPGGLT